jgi:hypothetical protein
VNFSNECSNLVGGSAFTDCYVDERHTFSSVWLSGSAAWVLFTDLIESSALCGPLPVGDVTFLYLKPGRLYCNLLIGLRLSKFAAPKRGEDDSPATDSKTPTRVAGQCPSGLHVRSRVLLDLKGVVRRRPATPSKIRITGSRISRRLLFGR